MSSVMRRRSEVMRQGRCERKAPRGAAACSRRRAVRKSAGFRRRVHKARRDQTDVAAITELPRSGLVQPAEGLTLVRRLIPLKIRSLLNHRRVNPFGGRYKLPPE